MNQKEKRLFSGFSKFLFLCTVINFFTGHTGAAVCGLGAGAFYLALSSASQDKSKETNQEIA